MSCCADCRFWVKPYPPYTPATVGFCEWARHHGANVRPLVAGTHRITKAGLETEAHAKCDHFAPCRGGEERRRSQEVYKIAP